MGYFTETFNTIYDDMVIEEGGWGVDADSTTLKKEMKWYNKFVQKARTRTDKIDAIDDRLAVLKQCSKDMKATRNNTNGKNLKERLAYGFKSLIPFNTIARLIDKQDLFSTGAGVGGGVISNVGGKVAGKAAAKAAVSAKTMEDLVGAGTKAIGGGAAAGLAGTAFMVGVRIGTFNKMLDRCIKNTDDAIDYLEKLKKELKNKK